MTGAATRLRVVEVRTRSEQAEFIRLAWRLNRGRPLWVPPLLTDERRYVVPGRGAAPRCETVAALAFRDGEAVGRILGLVQHRHNELTGARTARFARLECVDDVEVARGLLGFVESWGAGRGMDRVVGPMEGSDQEPEGFLIDGFQFDPTIATYYNPEYIPSLLEGCGYGKEVDYVVYRIDVPGELPEFYRRILARSEARGSFRLKEFRRRGELRGYIEPIFKLMGSAYEGIYGFVPPTPEEQRALARQYLPLLDPRFVKVAEKDGEVVGFIVGMPNLARGLRRANGRLLPIGFLHVLREMRRSRQLDLLLGGVRADCRGRGVDVLVGAAMLREAHRGGFRLMDSHHELETNLPMRAEMEKFGAVIYKRYRIYGKALPAGGAGAPAPRPAAALSAGDG